MKTQLDFAVKSIKIPPGLMERSLKWIDEHNKTDRDHRLDYSKFIRMVLEKFLDSQK